MTTISSKKKIGWENALIDYLASVAGKRFRPSKTDCAMFSLGGYVAMTGDRSVFDDFYGKYTTLEEGYALLSERGFENHIDFAASKLSEWPSPLQAQRGDLAVLEAGDGAFALGIVQGENIYVMTPGGLGLRRLTEAIRAFHV